MRSTDTRRRVPLSFVVTLGAASLMMAVGMASVLAAPASTDVNDGCYSLIFMDGGSTAKTPESALAKAASWATAFSPSADSTHPLEAERMAAIAAAAARATPIAVDPARVVYEASTNGRLDGRFVVAATEGGWMVSTVTVRAPSAFCAPQE
jgi:hypothetical protein